MLDLWLASTYCYSTKPCTLGRVASAAVEILATDPNTFANGGWQRFCINSVEQGPAINTPLLTATRPGCTILSIGELALIRRQQGKDFHLSNYFPKDKLDSLRRLGLLLDRTLGSNYNLDGVIRVPTNVYSYEWPPTLEELTQPFISGRTLPSMPEARPSATRQDALTHAVHWMVGREVPVDLSSEEGIVTTCLALEADLDGSAPYEKLFASS